MQHVFHSDVLIVNLLIVVAVVAVAGSPRHFEQRLTRPVGQPVLASVFGHSPTRFSQWRARCRQYIQHARQDQMLLLSLAFAQLSLLCSLLSLTPTFSPTSPLTVHPHNNTLK
jgi:hypothetical protein